MPIFVTCGHQFSGQQDIERLLQSSGVKEATPSLHHQILPTVLINKILSSKNLGETPSSHCQHPHPGKVWQSLAIDLIASNMDQEYWGWADPKNINLLEFWRDLTPDSHYILVYASPELTIAQLLSTEPPSTEMVLKALADWQSYNTELLRFYLKNQNQCHLVNSATVRNAPRDLITHINERGSLNLSEQMLISKQPEPAEPTAILMARLLIQEADAETVSLFQELESAADLPSANFLSNEKTDLNALMLNSWESFSDPDQQVLKGQIKPHNLAQRLDEQKKENELIKFQLHQLQEELELIYQEYQGLKNQTENKPSPQVPKLIPTSDQDHIIDMRHYIEASNWYHAEHDGRWAGPANTSTLKMPPLPQGEYQLELRVISAMSPEIVRKMQLSSNGQPLTIKTKVPLTNPKALLRRYYLLIFKKREGGPLSLTSHFKVNGFEAGVAMDLEFMFPKTISPASRGERDTRRLAIKLAYVKITPKIRNQV